MDIFESLVQFFEIDGLAANSTLVDLLQYGISILVSVYLVCFIIRSLFLMVTVPNTRW